MDKYKYLFKNLCFFVIGKFIPRTISFFMVPLYTNCLSTSEYGTADLLTNTVALIMPILTLQLQDAVLKFSIEKKHELKGILGTAVKIAAAGGMILILLCSFLSAAGVFNFDRLFYVFICVNYFIGSLSNIFSYFCRGIDKVKIIAIGGIITTAVAVSVNILCLLYLDMGLYGYMLANTLGNFSGTLFIFAAAKLYSYIEITLKKTDLEREMIKISIPMIFSALSWWVNSASDKYILTFISGVSTVGLYSVSNKIPTIISVFGDIISKTFSISAIKDLDYKDKDGFLGNCFSFISFFSVLAASILILLNVFISKILFAKEFYEAWKFVPPLLVSSVMMINSGTCESIFLAIGKTKIISMTAVAGAGINTVMNFVLIYLFGAYGAAASTAISFSVVFLIRYTVLKKYVDLKNNAIKDFVSYLLLLLQTVLAYYGMKYILIQAILTASISMLYIKDAKRMLKIRRCRDD